MSTMVATIHVSLRIKPIISYESGKYCKRNYHPPQQKILKYSLFIL